MTALNKQAYRADGGDIGIGRLKEIADNAYSDEEKRWLAQRVLSLLDKLEKEKGYASAYEGEKWHYHQLAESEGERANRAEAKIKAVENNLIDSECHVAELEESLRDKQALLESAEKLNAELNQRNTVLTAKIEPMDRRIAELEARTVTLPEPFKLAKSSSGLTYYYADEVDAAIQSAGIGVKGE